MKFKEIKKDNLVLQVTKNKNLKLCRVTRVSQQSYGMLGISVEGRKAPFRAVSHFRHSEESYGSVIWADPWDGLRRVKGAAPEDLMAISAKLIVLEDYL